MKVGRFTLLICMCTFLIPAQNLLAQDALKERINNLIQSYRSSEEDTLKDPVILPKDEPDLADSDTALIPADTLKNMNSDVDDLDVSELEEAQKEAKSIDTTSFVKRVLTVKKRRPRKEFNKERQWSEYYNIVNTGAYKKKHVLNSDYKVFGWHPYWMGDAYKSYNFSLLSAVAYFSYELNPNTGGYYTVHDWKTTALVDSAHNHNTKILLSVTNFGYDNNNAFLSNLSAQQNFISTIISLLTERNADGINIDFENIPKARKRDLTNFIIDLSTSLKAVKKDMLITIALPPIDYNKVYDFFQLNQYIDMFIMMGYEFYGVNSSVAGPVAPLQSGQIWWDYNLETAVEEYLVEGIVPKKLLLGLPYYGAEWQTEDLKFPSKAERFIRYPMYRTVRKQHGVLSCCEDEASKSKFYVYRDDAGRYRQLWYEDSTTLGKKYDWIMEQGIGGVGIWALGYDNGYNELWQLLAQKFALTDKAAKKAVARSFWKRLSPRRLLFMVLRIMKDPSYLMRNPRPLFSIFGALFGVSMIGFFVLFRFGHRLKRIFGVALKGSLALFIVILIALLFIGMKYMGTHEMLFLIGGFVIGAIIIFFFSKRFLTEKDLP